jgi:small-conductance mechanosensitive channel
VSNAKLLENRIHNYAVIHQRRVVMQVGIIYQTPPDIMEALPDEVRKIAESVPLIAFDRAHFWNFGASSIDMEIVFNVTASGMQEMMAARQAFMLGVVRRFSELDVDFAYPTQMGFLGGLDGKVVDPLAIPRDLQPAP